MGYAPLLPPGRWRTAADAARWDMLLEWNETVGDLYRQQLYRRFIDPKFEGRPQNPAFRARLEQRHTEKCRQVDAAIRSHLERNYLLDSGTLDPGFELEWVFFP